MVVLAMVVFVMPLTVFSVVYHSYALKTEANSAVIEKNYQTVRGLLELKTGAKGDELIFLTTKLNKIYKLTGSVTVFNTLKRLDGTNVVAVGWMSTSGLYVVSVSVAR